MLTTCAEPGCNTFVLGGFCLVHDAPQTRVFVRGRPFARPVTAIWPYTSRGRAPVESRRTLVRATGTVLVGAARATVPH
jgi:hypothetical protein